MRSKQFFTLLLIATIALFAIMLYQKRRSPSTLEKTSLPHYRHSIKHLALIMDGNRRWAKQRGLKAFEGHQKGTQAVKESVRFCIKNKIPHLTLYAFSLENFKRSPEELRYLFSIIRDGLNESEFQELLEKGVRVRFIGDRSRFPSDLLESITNLEEKTKKGTALSLNLLFCYGGQQEIVAATKRIAQLVTDHKIKPSEITPELFQSFLWLSDAPAPDLVIRTGGQQRLSNFLPWQSTYSELMFIPTLWPAITEQDLATAVTLFEERKRNFGA